MFMVSACRCREIRSRWCWGKFSTASPASPDRQLAMEMAVHLNHIDLPVVDIAGARDFFESHFGIRCIVARDGGLALGQLAVAAAACDPFAP